MWSLITTTLPNRNQAWGALVLVSTCIAGVCFAQRADLRPPTAVTAGQSTVIATSGSGEATLYLLGPNHTSRKQVHLGQEIPIAIDEVRTAGRYLTILCSTSGCHSAFFYVTPSSPASLSFLVHPSRVPVKQQNAISGVAFSYDKFNNLVLAPVTIDFQLRSSADESTSRFATTRNGVAWFRTNSSDHAGTTQLVAAVGDLSVHRFVQQVAGDPCNLRVKGQRTAKGILVETEPVRDCSGNPVPDGTVVTFTQTSEGGKSTVDMPIKQGVARAQFLESGPAVISAASGVAMGNQLQVGEK
jgi:hypothetical protein